MEELKPLVVKAQAGDIEAFGRIVDRFRDMAYGYGYSILGDFDQAQDVAQDAFVQAYRNLPDLRDPAAFPGWLKRIVFTCCTRLTRSKRGAAEPLEAISEVPSASPGPAELAERGELQDRVLDAIRALPENERAATTLFYINGYSHNEIADFLEVPVTTVKSRLHASRKRLKERMLTMVGDHLQGHPLPEAFTGRVLANIPPGTADRNSFAQGLTTILNYSGVLADYDTVMGDLGWAFIMQASEQTAVIDGALDVGWWPLAGWCLSTYLGFVGQTVGREIQFIPGVGDRRADPARYYQDNYHQHVKASVDAGEPLLALTGNWFVVAGYDDQEPPLLGNWSLWDKAETIRIDEYPCPMVRLGKKIPRLERTAVDLEALRHAVAFGRDQAPVPEGRLTGQKSFALWARILRDTEHLGEARWHSNVVLHLGINRHSAVAYLRAMAERHPRNTAAHLRTAADVYEEVLAQLKTEDTSQDAMMSRDGRGKLATLVERIAAIEARATAELERALAAADVPQ